MDEQLSDFEIPCGYSVHPDGGPAASWAVWFRPVYLCGHYATDFMYFCDPCWARRNSTGWVYCTKCARLTPASAPVLRVERI